MLWKRRLVSLASLYHLDFRPRETDRNPRTARLVRLAIRYRTSKNPLRDKPASRRIARCISRFDRDHAHASHDNFTNFSTFRGTFALTLHELHQPLNSPTCPRVEVPAIVNPGRRCNVGSGPSGREPWGVRGPQSRAPKRARSSKPPPVSIRLVSTVRRPIKAARAP